MKHSTSIIALSCLYVVIAMVPMAADAQATGGSTPCDANQGPCQEGTAAPGGETNGGTQTNSGFRALVPIPGLTDVSPTSVINSATLANFFNNLYKYLIGLAAIFAIVQIIRSGLEVATNQESVSKLIDAKGRIAQTIAGLVLVLSPVLVFSVINPSILNLSINLPALDTAAPTPAAVSRADGAQCFQKTDCDSNICTRPAIGDAPGICEHYARGTQCTANEQCASGDCNTSVSPAVCRDKSVESSLVLDGGACTDNMQCVSTVCDSVKMTCAAVGDFPTNAACTRDVQCRSGDCSLHGNGKYQCNAPPAEDSRLF